MDILELVDRLEELFNESRAVPFTHSVLVDEDRFLDLIDQMRVTIPEEVRKAQQLLAQRERILAQAKEEAQRTIQLAQQKREEMLSEHRLVEEAQRKARQIIAQAETEAERIRREADQYALESLEKLALQLDRMLTEVQNGIRVLQEVQGVPPEGE